MIYQAPFFRKSRSGLWGEGAKLQNILVVGADRRIGQKAHLHDITPVCTSIGGLEIISPDIILSIGVAGKHEKGFGCISVSLPLS